MSVYAVNYLCRELLRDHAFRAAMKADPAKALSGLDLTEDERRALLAGDVGTLFRMGVNGFLMGYLARFEVCGLNVQIYNERMRAVKVDEIGQPVA
jgi:Aromatic-ring-opening dioxygenase LigAB, LigA subunit